MTKKKYLIPLLFITLPLVTKANGVTTCQKAINYFENKDRICNKNDLFDLENYSQIAKACNKAVVENLEDNEYLVALAIVQMGLGEFETARRNLEKAINQGSTKAKVLLDSTNLFSFMRQNNIEAAKKYAFELQDLAKSGNTEALRTVSVLLLGKPENRLLKYNEKDIINWIKEKAEKGDRKLQYFLGLYSGSLGNEYQSIYWHEKSAEQGHCTASSYVESKLDDLTNPNLSEKIRDVLQQFIFSAESGNPYAQNSLANYYDFNMNSKESVKWRKLAAKNGNLDAQYWLGLLYYSGSGVEKNLQKSKFWLNKAIEQGSKSAAIALANFEK